jgi:hypothetical protein
VGGVGKAEVVKANTMSETRMRKSENFALITKIVAYFVSILMIESVTKQ